MCDKTRTKEVGVLQADPDVRPNVKSRLPSYEDRWWFFFFFGNLVMLENRWEVRK